MRKKIILVLCMIIVSAIVYTSYNTDNLVQIILNVISNLIKGLLI